jgi:DNA repair protein RecN (Recombination protein N)
VLTALAIQNVVLIEALAIEFAPGLVVLTGETGAGKSILLDALGLVLGSRADAGLVRAGSDTARVVAEFDVGAGHPARALLAENELEADGAIILRRQLKADGGSRAFVNDQPVSATLLRELGAALVEIHGQHDERGLLSPKGHRAQLDQFAGLGDHLLAARDSWEASRAPKPAKRRLAHGSKPAADQRDREWLDHAVKPNWTRSTCSQAEEEEARTARGSRRHAEGRAADR